MTVYLILIVLVWLFGVGFKANRSISGRKIFVWISFLMMTVISCFRDVSVGVDTKYYVNIFQNISIYNFAISRYEIGFLYFLKAVHFISDDPYFLLTVCSIICIGIPCIFIYRHSEDVVLAMLLYIVLKSYFSQMTLIRQALATVFVMEAFSILLRGRNTKRIVLSVCFILLGASFHTLAVTAFIPFVIMIWPKLNYKIKPAPILKWSILLMIIVFVFYPFVMRLVSLVVPQYAVYFSGRWSDSNYSASLFKLLIQLVFLIVGIIYIREKEILSDEDRLSLIMLMLSVVTLTLSMRMEIWGRLAGLFSCYTAVLWAPSFTSCIKDVKNRMAVKSSVFLFSFAYMLVTFIFRPGWDGVVPYLFR